jgi:hypothetical protein
MLRAIIIDVVKLMDKLNPVSKAIAKGKILKRRVLFFCGNSSISDGY